jgi:Mg-chelatase subunit ChlD
MPGVSHTVKCGRTAYGPAAQAVQCMASLRASEFESPDRKPVDLVLVIDKSGSMNGAKMVLTKETAELVVRELGPTDRLAIVAYDTDVSCDLGLCLMDSRGKAAARAKIAGIRPGSCTNLSGGLLRGLEELGAEGGAETASVLLLTDGLANRGIMGTTDIVRVVEGVTRDSSNPPSVFTFGYGADHNAEMLRAISDAGNGQYYFMEDGDAVATSFADALGGLLSVVAQNVRLTLGCHGGAVTRVLGKAYSSTISEGTIELSIGDLYSEEAKDILFEVFIPPGVPALSEVAIVATISYLDVVQGKIVSGVAAQAQIARAAEDGAADIEVAEHMNRTDCAQALLMAGGLGAQGQYAAARALLSEAMTKLTVSAAKDSPLTVQLVADMQEALDGFRDARSYRSKGSYDCQSMQQAHSKQRSNKAPKGGRAAWAAGDDAVGASPYMTKSKRAMAVRWSSSPMEPPVAPATPVVEPPAVAFSQQKLSEPFVMVGQEEQRQMVPPPPRKKQQTHVQGQAPPVPMKAQEAVPPVVAPAQGFFGGLFGGA